MKAVSMRCENLKEWVNNKAKIGDVALWFDSMNEKQYMYIFKGPDPSPYWIQVSNPKLPQGWECPKCGAVMSPSSNHCINCTGYFNNTYNSIPNNINSIEWGYIIMLTNKKHLTTQS